MIALTGTGGLVRLILRRDRVLLPLWAVGIAVVPVSYVASLDGLYPTAADRLAYAATAGGQAVFLALYGPLFGTDLGALVAQRAGFLPVVLALCTLLTVIRHTRTEEEAGRRELLGATVVGRHAPLAAAGLVALGANAVFAVVLAGLAATQGLSGPGSVAFGLSIAGSGLVFGAVGGLAAQLSTQASTARGIAIGLLGVATGLRIAGDVGDAGWLSWLSPIGWSHRVRAYAGERWWVLLLPVAASAVLAAAAGAVSARRDVGAGVLAPRPGPAVGALRGPFGLAWRLHRARLASWAAAFLALGAVFGGAAGSVGELVRDNPALADVFARLGGPGGLVDAYFAAVLGVVGLIAAGCGIQAAQRLRTEETDQHAEPLLSTPVSRLRWATSHLLPAALGPAAGLALAGLAAGLVYDPGQLGRVLAAALVQLPAVWLLTAVPVALFGLAPRLVPAAWGALVGCLLVGQLGGALELSHWVVDVSPFSHLPQLPGGPFVVTPVLWLLGLAALVAAAGLAGTRRRDLPA